MFNLHWRFLIHVPPAVLSLVNSKVFKFTNNFVFSFGEICKLEIKTGEVDPKVLSGFHKQLLADNVGSLNYRTLCQRAREKNTESSFI
jgi:hypothetical protein